MFNAPISVRTRRSQLPDMLDARGLHSFYGSSHILHGVDFSVAEGEAVALMGRNGMGKTTLIRSMLGLVPPRSGSVHMAGMPVTGWAPFRIAARYRLYSRRPWRFSQPFRARESVDGGTTASRRSRKMAAGPCPPGVPTVGGPALASRRAIIRRRTADADHRPRFDDRPATPYSGRGDGRPGAADRASGLAHDTRAARRRHGDRDRRQELRHAVAACPSLRHPGERTQGIRRAAGGPRRSARIARAVAGRLAVHARCP